MAGDKSSANESAYGSRVLADVRRHSFCVRIASERDRRRAPCRSSLRPIAPLRRFVIDQVSLPSSSNTPRADSPWRRTVRTPGTQTGPGNSPARTACAPSITPAAGGWATTPTACAGIAAGSRCSLVDHRAGIGLYHPSIVVSAVSSSVIACDRNAAVSAATSVRRLLLRWSGAALHQASPGRVNSGRAGHVEPEVSCSCPFRDGRAGWVIASAPPRGGGRGRGSSCRWTGAPRRCHAVIMRSRRSCR